MDGETFFLALLSGHPLLLRYYVRLLELATAICFSISSNSQFPFYSSSRHLSRYRFSM